MTFATVVEDDICRVCRGTADENQPLFYPCKCSGSIRYVHEACLKEWLKHSKKSHCELCGYQFTFAPGNKYHFIAFS